MPKLLVGGMPIANPAMFVNSVQLKTRWNYASLIVNGCKPSEEADRKAGLAMAMEEQSLGLCLTCNSQDICIRRKNIKLPVLYCEEFDDSTTLSAEAPEVSALPKEKAALDISMGLCCNCGNHATCTLRQSPGGIWHCEEYC